MGIVEKEIVNANPDAFAPESLLADAMGKVITANREEAINRVRKLIEKEYQQRRELSEAKKKVASIEEGLKKTTDKAAKLRSGDLSVLFEGDNQSQNQ